jgi:hypothetical protein
MPLTARKHAAQADAVRFVAAIAGAKWTPIRQISPMTQLQSRRQKYPPMRICQGSTPQILFFTPDDELAKAVLHRSTTQRTIRRVQTGNRHNLG